MNMSLYALTEQFRELQALAASDEDIDELTLLDTLDAVGGELELKAQSIARIIANQEAFAKAVEDASKAMALRAKRLNSRTDWLRNYLRVNMEAAGITKLESPELSLSLKKNPPSVVVFDEAAVPGDLMVQKPPPPPAPDKTRIKELLKAGTDVPGCRLEQGTRLEIK